MKSVLLYLLFLCPAPGFTQTGLFDSDSILQLKLSGDIRKLMNDRRDNPDEYPIVLSYMDGSKEISIPINSRTRGNFRRKLGGCTYPPILLIFKNHPEKENTLFQEQQKLKLVVPCKDADYVVREYMAYRIFNLITPMSFKARLVKLVLDDNKKKNQAAFYSILLEEEDQMAKRNNMIAVEKKIPPILTDTRTFLNMAVFEFLIGNTDWSVEYQQNVKLIAKDSLSQPFTVPYDFDHAGLVDAPYAQPAEALELSSVRERRYRGYCLTDLKEYAESFEVFNKIRNQIYSLYQSAPYLTSSVKTTAIKYLDDFYNTINDPDKMKKAFSYPCDEKGTGEIIIKGIKN